MKNAFLNFVLISYFKRDNHATENSVLTDCFNIKQFRQDLTTTQSYCNICCATNTAYFFTRAN